ncbi:MAG TPA: BON domain-containing protein [Chromatiales bacterium]|nr:BON domain-containing protein [Chromatiales bacterium]
MSQNQELIKRIHAALEVDPGVNTHHDELRIVAEGDVVTLDGTVQDIVEKRRAVIAAARVDGVREVIDELRLEMVEPMGQEECLQHVRNALYEEPVFCDYRIVTLNRKGERELVREPTEAAGEIIVMVEDDNRVVLGGVARSLSHQRMAEVLAWWVPGSANVKNDIEVDPPEEDNDGEILDAVELVLEKDHMINREDMTLSCKDAVVTLAGGIPTGTQKRLAEYDAWYVNGVLDVVNELVPVDPATM